MNNDEAKFILGAYRPGGHDSGDPVLAEALEKAQRDPALRVWLEREQAFDTAVSAKLRAVQPPSGLRDAILAGAKVSRSRPTWVRPLWVGLAAAIVLALTLWSLRPYTSADGGFSTEGLARFAALDVRGDHAGAVHANRAGVVGAWLQDPTNRLLAGIPADTARLQADRCRVVRFAGRDVFEICFKRDAVFHVYISPRRNSDSASDTAAPMFREHGTLASVSWGDARNIYVMVTDAGVDALRRIL